MAEILCITGMHRSGTSLIASWLETCGLTTHDGAVWGPDTGNIRGHFEDVDFVEIQSRRIKELDPRSKGWITFNPESIYFDPETLPVAAQLVDERNEKYNTWGWKDPRTVLFLDQWRIIVPSLKVLLIWRPCVEVTKSLIARSRESAQPHLKINPMTAARLWKSYNQKVHIYKQMHPDEALLFPLSYILEHDRRFIDALNSRLEMNLSYTPLRDIFNPSLLHRSRTFPLIRALCFLTGTRDLELELESLSDIT